MTVGDRALGAFALGCFAIHVARHFIHHAPAEALWICTLGAAIVGVGALVRRFTVVGIGTLWLLLGTPLWVVDLGFGGGEFLPTSLLTHVGALSAGVLLCHRHPPPNGTAARAWGWALLLLAVTRVATPSAENVNLVHHVAPGWESWFPDHRVYLGGLVILAFGVFWLGERALRASVRSPARA